MRILIIDAYYPGFLRQFAARHPNLNRTSYEEQWRALMDQGFGTADFYSRNLEKLGHEAKEIVINCTSLQRQWAKEHNIDIRDTRLAVRRRFKVVPGVRRIPRDWHTDIMMAQVKEYRPDVVHVQIMDSLDPVCLRELRSFVRLITGQIACPLPPRADFRAYDVVLSSFPHFVSRFRAQGLASEYFNLGFEPGVLGRVPPASRKYGTTFLGGISSAHDERIKFLEEIARTCSLDLWGYGVDSLPPDSCLRAGYHGESWGLDMYAVLRQSDIVLNHHINVAQDCANNMRLFEATGMGSLLLTDQKSNLHTLFAPGSEVVPYAAASECCELIEYYQNHSEARDAIALAGQRRTLASHTWYHRMQEYLEIVQKYV